MSGVSVNEVRSPPGRPRDPDVDAAVLRSTQDLLVERGYAGMTVEAVARAARSGKAAVYRRWPSKAHLVVAAVRALSDEESVPDTGSLREDLLECALHYARFDGRSARVLASLLSEIGRDAELREAAYDTIGGPPIARLRVVLDRWVARGAISPAAPVELVAGIVPSVGFRNIVLRQRALDPQAVTDLVDRVLLPALLTTGAAESGGGSDQSDPVDPTPRSAS